LLEQMESEPLSRLPADPGESGQFSDQLLNCAHRLERGRKRQLGNFPHLGLKHLGCTPLSLGDSGEYQLAQEICVTFLEYRGIDNYCSNGAAAISGHLHHASASRGLDGAGCQLRLELLEPTLYLLSQLKKLLKICHAIG